MSRPTYQRILESVDRLGLKRIKEVLPSTLAAAEKESWGLVKLLDRLFEEELAARDERRIRTALGKAGFPFLKTLDSFDFAFQPSIDRSRIMDLASLGFLAQKHNLLFLGPPGVGKTHLAVALGVAACQHGYSVHFTTLQNMINNLAKADQAGKLRLKLRSYTTKPQLIVIDEVGYLPLNRIEANYLFQVVSYRYERSSIILTSNKSVTEWPELLGDHALATAVLDRLLHHAIVFSIRGNSYRLRDKVKAGLLQAESGPTPAPSSETALQNGI